MIKVMKVATLSEVSRVATPWIWLLDHRPRSRKKIVQ